MIIIFLLFFYIFFYFGIDTKIGEQSLYDYVIDDVNAGTVRGCSDLDILIKEYMHPRSPKVCQTSLCVALIVSSRI